MSRRKVLKDMVVVVEEMVSSLPIGRRVRRQVRRVYSRHSSSNRLGRMTTLNRKQSESKETDGRGTHLMTTTIGHALSSLFQRLEGKVEVCNWFISYHHSANDEMYGSDVLCV